MKNLLPLIALLWAFSAPLAAQAPAPNITLEAVFNDQALNGNRDNGHTEVLELLGKPMLEDARP